MSTESSADEKTPRKMNVLDLFCGCGGMSWGLAKKGFHILAGIDIWDKALATYAHSKSS